MFNISKLVNKITDRGNSREGEASGSMSIVDTDEQQHSEGFLCPPCMRAFPSAEALEAHYNATHVNSSPISNDSQNASPSSGDDIKGLREEIQNLQLCLAEEKCTAEELKQEVMKIKAGQNEDVPEKDFESVKALLHSEVALLRKQLTDSLELISELKKDKELLSHKVENHDVEATQLKSSLSNLESQLAHKNSTDDAAVLKQELVSVQRMMDSLALEKENEIDSLKKKLENAMKSESSITNDLETKLSEIVKQNEDLTAKVKALVLNEQILRDKNSVEIIALNDELRIATGKFDSAMNTKMSLESESQSLKDEVKRLQEQHTELYRRVEGGEGAKAALDSLQKENEVLKDNLQSSVEKHTEITKNLHNTTQQLERAQMEQKKMMEALMAEKEERKAKSLLWTDQMNQKTDELKRATSKIDELSKTMVQKETSLSEAVSQSESAIKELQKQLENLQKQKADELAQASTKIDDLSKEIALKDAKISQIEHEMETSSKEFKIQLESVQNEKAKFEAGMQNLQAEVKDLKENLLKTQSSLEALHKKEETLNVQLADKVSQIKQLNEKLDHTKELNVKLESELSTAKNTLKEVEARSESQIETMKSQIIKETELKCQYMEQYKTLETSSLENEKKAKIALEKALEGEEKKTKELKELEKTFQDMKRRTDESESKLQVLQSQTDTVLAGKIDLEKRLKSSEDEKTILLEKCLSGESETEKLNGTIKSLQRKLEDSNAALQELGRENQSLQMESAKLQGRKWLDDSVVTQCPTCEKEFTLTIRKHHCRHCGNIYCNDCSSRTAAVPSYKKPARVCDTCYQELLSK